MQVRNYNVANGITKAVTASLETQDILEAKHKTYRKMLHEVHELLRLYQREESVEGITPEVILEESVLETATTEFVANNVLATVILADVEISRCPTLPHHVHTQPALYYTRS